MFWSYQILLVPLFINFEYYWNNSIGLISGIA